MFEHRDPTGSSFFTYELSADDFELYPGDTVAPDYEIGIDIWSGSPVYMDGWGKVATAYYNPMNHSYLVMINRYRKTRTDAGKRNEKHIAATQMSCRS